MSGDYPQVTVASEAEWRAWLHDNHATSPGIWLTTWKKNRGPYLPYDDVVDQALCFGWVDSQPRTLDTNRTQRLLTPRRPGCVVVRRVPAGCQVVVGRAACCARRSASRSNCWRIRCRLTARNTRRAGRRLRFSVNVSRSVNLQPCSVARSS